MLVIVEEALALVSAGDAEVQSHVVCENLLARGLVLNASMCLFAVLAFVCTIMSPICDTLGANAGNSWASTWRRGLLGCGALVFGYLPIVIASGPAAIGTSCDDLTEIFNSVRLNDLRPETDAMLSILERALGNSNHGHGKPCCFSYAIDMLLKLSLQAWVLM